jgi:hypothetical protein
MANCSQVKTLVTMTSTQINFTEMVSVVFIFLISIFTRPFPTPLYLPVKDYIQTISTEHMVVGKTFCMASHFCIPPQIETDGNVLEMCCVGLQFELNPSSYHGHSLLPIHSPVALLFLTSKGDLLDDSDAG